MRTRYSIILPVCAILSGVVLELNSLNLIGNFLPNDILLKFWPVILIFAGLDMLISHRRLIGAMVILFFGGALLSTQLMPEGWNNQIWLFFMKVWPILLILFGLDCIFSGTKLINTAVIIAGVLILVYILLTVLNVPVVKSLPINIDLSSIIPTSTFEGIRPSQPGATQTGPQVLPQMMPQNTQQNMMQFDSQPVPETVQEPIVYSANGSISAAMPGQSVAVLDINAASGKISIKAGDQGGQFLNGTIKLDPSEKLSPNAAPGGQTAQYTLTSSGRAASPQNSNWDLALTTQRTVSLNTVLNSGYVKADLRSLNLSDVNIENKYGPVDVMVPHATNAKINIKASGDNIRIYVPAGTSVSGVITGASSIDYPQWDYTLSGNILSPRRGTQAPISLEISVSGGSVQIINIG